MFMILYRMLDLSRWILIRWLIGVQIQGTLPKFKGSIPFGGGLWKARRRENGGCILFGGGFEKLVGERTEDASRLMRALKSSSERERRMRHPTDSVEPTRGGGKIPI
jgi:hypothetical protein